VSGAVARTLRRQDEPKPSSGGIPIWVSIVYFLGLLSVAFVVFAVVARFLPLTLHVSVVAIVVWVALIALAAIVFVGRRRGS
jgi:Flp pilus assembly protein TadB